MSLWFEIVIVILFILLIFTIDYGFVVVANEIIRLKLFFEDEKKKESYKHLQRVVKKYKP